MMICCELKAEMPSHIGGKTIYGVLDGLIEGAEIVESLKAYDSLVIGLENK